MQTREPEDINAQIMDRIGALLEQLILQKVVDALYSLIERQRLLPRSICYKPDCPMRDDIPF